jgi:hypothetical protein
MKYQQEVRKLLKRVLHGGRATQSEGSPLEEWSLRVPENLCTNEMKSQEGYPYFILSEAEFKAFQDIYQKMRRDLAFEYLTDSDLREKLEQILCEVLVNRKHYRNDRNLDERVVQFLAELAKPVEDYEVMFKVVNVEIRGKEEVLLWDATFLRMNKTKLMGWGLNRARGLSPAAVDEFDNKTLIIVKQSGNNQELILNRARKRAALVLNALQMYLSELRFVYDDQLSFGLSGLSAIRKVTSHKSAGVQDVGEHTLESKSPFAVHLGRDERFDEFFSKAQHELSTIGAFGPEIKAMVERAIRWIGKAIDETDPDYKVIALCTAMESLLTERNDGRKGEAIAFRMVLLASLLERNSLYPHLVLHIYGLRSKVIHGSSIEESTMHEYRLLKTAVKMVFHNFISIVDREKITKRSKLLAIIDTSKYSTKLIEQLEEYDDPYSKEIVEALRKAVAKRSPVA